MITHTVFEFKFTRVNFNGDKAESVRLKKVLICVVHLNYQTINLSATYQHFILHDRCVVVNVNLK